MDYNLYTKLKGLSPQQEGRPSPIDTDDPNELLARTRRYFEAYLKRQRGTAGGKKEHLIGTAVAIFGVDANEARQVFQEMLAAKGIAEDKLVKIDQPALKDEKPEEDEVAVDANLEPVDFKKDQEDTLTPVTDKDMEEPTQLLDAQGRAYLDTMFGKKRPNEAKRKGYELGGWTDEFKKDKDENEFRREREDSKKDKEKTDEAKVIEGLHELVVELDNITEEEKALIATAIEKGVIRNEIPAYDDMINCIIDLDTAEKIGYEEAQEILRTGILGTADKMRVTADWVKGVILPFIQGELGDHDVGDMYHPPEKTMHPDTSVFEPDDEKQRESVSPVLHICNDCAKTFTATEAKCTNCQSENVEAIVEEHDDTEAGRLGYTPEQWALLDHIESSMDSFVTDLDDTYTWDVVQPVSAQAVYEWLEDKQPEIFQSVLRDPDVLSTDAGSEAFFEAMDDLGIARRKPEVDHSREDRAEEDRRPFEEGLENYDQMAVDDVRQLGARLLYKKHYDDMTDEEKTELEQRIKNLLGVKEAKELSEPEKLTLKRAADTMKGETTGLSKEQARAIIKDLTGMDEPSRKLTGREKMWLKRAADTMKGETTGMSKEQARTIIKKLTDMNEPVDESITLKELRDLIPELDIPADDKILLNQAFEEGFLEDKTPSYTYMLQQLIDGGHAERVALEDTGPALKTGELAGVADVAEAYLQDIILPKLRRRYGVEDVDEANKDKNKDDDGEITIPDKPVKEAGDDSKVYAAIISVGRFGRMSKKVVPFNRQLLAAGLVDEEAAGLYDEDVISDAVMLRFETISMGLSDDRKSAAQAISRGDFPYVAVWEEGVVAISVDKNEAIEAAKQKWAEMEGLGDGFDEGVEEAKISEPKEMEAELKKTAAAKGWKVGGERYNQYVYGTLAKHKKDQKESHVNEMHANDRRIMRILAGYFKLNQDYSFTGDGSVKPTDEATGETIAELINNSAQLAEGYVAYYDDKDNEVVIVMSDPTEANLGDEDEDNIPEDEIPSADELERNIKFDPREAKVDEKEIDPDFPEAFKPGDVGHIQRRPFRGAAHQALVRKHHGVPTADDLEKLKFGSREDFKEDRDKDVEDMKTPEQVATLKIKWAHQKFGKFYAELDADEKALVDKEFNEAKISEPKEMEAEPDQYTGGLYTGYYVTVSGNRRFPGGGTVMELAASGPEDAYRKAFLKSQDMTPEEFEEEYGPDTPASKLVEYQRGVWAKEQLDDGSLLLVATGKRSKYEMIGLTDSIWAGDEMEESKVNEFNDEKTYTPLGRGLEKEAAEDIARDEDGQVVVDDEDESKFMVVKRADEKKISAAEAEKRPASQQYKCNICLKDFGDPADLNPEDLCRICAKRQAKESRQLYTKKEARSEFRRYLP